MVCACILSKVLIIVLLLECSIGENIVIRNEKNLPVSNDYGENDEFCPKNVVPGDKFKTSERFEALKQKIYGKFL